MNRLERILIVRLGGIGDVVCTLPALETLRAGFPHAFIGYAVEEPAFDIVNGHPALDTVHLFPRRRFVRELKNPLQWSFAFRDVRDYRGSLQKCSYDIALDLQRNLKGAIHTKMSSAKRNIGFTAPTAREFNHWFYREHVEPDPATHWVDKFLAMAAAIGGKPDTTRYRLPDAPESRSRVETFLRDQGMGTFIAMHPSASAFDPARRWEPERFGAVAKKIGTDFGFKTIVTWGPRERAIAETVVASSGGWAILNAESRSLLDIAELYRRARLYIGCDTGPMHIATAVGLPSLVLFGSGNPEAYGPRSIGSKIIANYSNDGTLLPMSDIDVEDVLAQAFQILS